MPDFDLLGKQFGGGDYQVKIYGNGRYLMSKMFSISKESYPRGMVNVDNVMPQTNPVNVHADNSGMEKVLEMFVTQNNMLMQTLLSKKEEKKDSLYDTIKLVKELIPPAPTMPYEMMFNMAGQMFQAGISLKEKIEEKEDGEDLTSVLLGMVKDFSKNIPVLMQGLGGNKNFFDNAQGATPSNQGAVTSNAQPAQVTAGATQQPMSVADKQKQLLILLKDYFDDVILAFESETFVHTYHLAEKVYKIGKFKPIIALVKGLPTEQIISILATYGLKKRIDDTETEKDDKTFKAFVTEIIDIIRDFDIITLNDEGEIVKAQRAEVNENDNERKQPEPVSDNAGTNDKPDSTEPESEPVNEQGDGD